MRNVIKNNTDFLVVFFAIACTILAFLKTMDVKDYIFIVGMVYAYKFGKSQTVDKPIVEENKLG